MSRGTLHQSLYPNNNPTPQSALASQRAPHPANCQCEECFAKTHAFNTRQLGVDPLPEATSDTPPPARESRPPAIAQPEAKAEDETAPPAKKRRKRQGRRVDLPTPELWEGPIDGEKLANELRGTFNRYLAMQPSVDVAVTLWTLHAHAHSAFSVSPLLNVHSPEMRCGKSTLLLLLFALTPKPLLAFNLSVSSVFRLAEKWAPTILWDEADATKWEDAEELRGLLNSGHLRAGANATRVEGQSLQVRLYSSWCPKVIASIKQPPGTIVDRSIPAPMRRRKSGENVTRLRLDQLSELEPLRRQAWTWAQGKLDSLKTADPAMPELSSDRAMDNWRVLVAVADEIGGAWPALARAAAGKLSGNDRAAPDSLGIMLLADLKQVFEDRDRMSTTSILAALTNLSERPWPEIHHGKPLNARGLARFLKPFEIEPTSDGASRGYDRKALEDAFDRYAPPAKEPAGPLAPIYPSVVSEAAPVAGETAFSIRQEAPTTDRSKSGPDPHKQRALTALTDRRVKTPTQAEQLRAAMAERNEGHFTDDDEPKPFIPGRDYGRGEGSGR